MSVNTACRGRKPDNQSCNRQLYVCTECRQHGCNLTECSNTLIDHTGRCIHCGAQSHKIKTKFSQSY